MPKLNAESAYIFRITHVDNLAWIFQNGLHCQSSTVQDPNFRAIGNPELIQKRSSRQVPVVPFGSFNDYIPFYFTPWSIMLYNIKTGHNGVPRLPNRDLVILISALRNIEKFGIPFVFTDGHAYTNGTEFYNQLDDTKQIDWDILGRKDFRHDPLDPQKKSRYQAEAMVYKHVPVAALLGVACYDADVQKNLVGLTPSESKGLSIQVLPSWYF